MGKKTCITATGVVKALEAMKADPVKTFNIANGVPNPKKHGSATFRQCRWNVGGKAIDGMFIGRDITLDNDIADPKNREDSRSKWESTRLRLESTMSKAGPTGEFMALTVDRFQAEVQARIASGDIVPEEGKDGRNMNVPLNRSFVSKKTKEVVTKDDPSIRWELEFKNYPDNYFIESMRGTPITQFFDATKPKDANATEFEPLLFEGDPITKDNVHKVITPDSVIRRLHFTMNTVAISDKGISLKCVANKIVIEIIRKNGVDDDDDDYPLTTSSSSMRPVPPITTSASPTPASSPTLSRAQPEATVPNATTAAEVPVGTTTTATTTTVTSTTVEATAAATADLDASLNALLGTV